MDAGDTTVYGITAGNTGGAFAIDNSGVITVANTAALDFETLSSFTLTVQVTDSGGLNDSQNVTVNLNDINEAPTDLNLAGSAVNENVANGTLVGTVVPVPAALLLFASALAALGWARRFPA